jgi:tyrosinase
MSKNKHKPHHKPDYDHNDHDHGHYEPPDNPRYPNRRIYGDYASKKPPKYVPHPFEHACFKPREQDYKPPVTCDGDGMDGLCNRKKPPGTDC